MTANQKHYSKSIKAIKPKKLEIKIQQRTKIKLKKLAQYRD